MKENDLVHGEFGSWAESVGFSSSNVSRYIRVFEEYSSMSTNLPSSKLLEMLSLPETVDRSEFIQQSHTIPSTGETKTVDDMTVRELPIAVNSFRRFPTIGIRLFCILNFRKDLNYRGNKD